MALSVGVIARASSHALVDSVRDEEQKRQDGATAVLLDFK